MSDPTTAPADYTDEELRQALARVIALARSKSLDDAEVQKFWEIYAEMMRRREATGDAA